MSLMQPGHSLSSLRPWMIWGLAAFFYGYEFFLQVSPSVMVNELMHVFSVNAATLGNLAAIYFYAYAAMQIPAGIFLDTLGPRKLLTITSAICAIGALLFGTAHVLFMAQLGRFFIGIGSAFAVIGTFKLAASWFPFQRFTFMVGLTIMVGMLGAVFGGAPLALLVDKVGWRTSMLILVLIGILLSFSIWFIVQDKPNHEPHSESMTAKFIKKNLIYIFKQPQSWFTALYGGLMFAPTSAFGALWGVPFLMTRYNLSRPIAASIISMIFIGWAAGSPTMGWFSDYIKKRKPTMYIANLGALITLLIVIYIPIHFLLLYVLLFLFGFFSSGFLPSYSIIREINPPSTNATALGFMNMLNMVGGALLQPLIGYILDLQWEHVFSHHVRVFSIHAYQMALLSLPITLGCALILVFFIRETYCQQVYTVS